MSETERRTDNDTRNRIALIADAYEAFAKRTVWILRLLVLLLVLGAIGFTFLLVRQSNASEESDRAIQSSRFRAIYEDCLDTNHRNENAKEIVDQEFKGEQSKTIVLILIEALAPFQDCQQEAEEATTPPGVDADESPEEVP